jgi:FkbM family methyltransferase
MYSERNEEQVILDYFGDFKGRYLDIGALDGVKSSNTLALAELGWSGMAIEASPLPFERLQKNYQERGLDHIELVNCAYAPESFPDQIKFYDFKEGRGLGSLSPNNLYWRPRVNKEKLDIYTVPTIKPSAVFRKPNFDFITIDTEAFNLETIATIPWDKLKRLRLVCIELDASPLRTIDFMTCVGFRMLARVDPNLFFVRENDRYQIQSTALEIE